MIPDRTIILATDFGHASENAYRYSLELGSGSHCQILVTHIYHHRAHASVSEYQRQAFRKQEFEAFAERTLRFSRLYPNITSPEILTHCRISTEVEEGAASEKLLELVERHKADAIVIGAKSHPGFFKKLFGQISQNIIYNTGCPVVVVPEEFKDGKPHRLGLLSIDESDHIRFGKVDVYPVIGTVADKVIVRISEGKEKKMQTIQGSISIEYTDLSDVVILLNQADIDMVAVYTGEDEHPEGHSRKQLIHTLYDKLECPLMCLHENQNPRR